MRLSTSSFAGTARTLVAVGTSSEASMFCTIRAATPRSGTTVAPAGTAPFGDALGAADGRAVDSGAGAGCGVSAGTVRRTGATVVAAGASVPARLADAV